MNHNEDIRRPDSEEIKNKADSPDYPETILGIELEKPQDTPPRELLSPDKVFVNNYLDYVKQAAVELAKVTEITAKTWDKHLAEGSKGEESNFSQVNFEGSMLGWLDLPSVPKKAAQDIFQSFQPVRRGGIDKHLNLDIPAKETTDLALNFEEGALPKSIAEKRSKAEILSSIVVAKAKLATIRPLAESVYPVFMDEFPKFDKFLDKVAEAAIQEKRASFSLMDILSNRQFQQAVMLTLGITGVLVFGFLTSGCSNQTRTPNPDASPTQPQVTEVMPTQQIIPTEIAPLPTAEPTFTAEPTITETAVAEETDIAAQEIIWINEKIEYGGKEMAFTLGYSSDDSSTISALEKFNVERFRFNDDNPDAKQNIEIILALGLLETYNFQNKESSITIDEYMANPSQYPAEIRVIDENGKLKNIMINLSQINEFNLRFTSNIRNLYYSIYEGTSMGYAFDPVRGSFTMYTFVSEKRIGGVFDPSWPIENVEYSIGVIPLSEIKVGASILQYSRDHFAGNLNDIDINPNKIQDEIKRMTDKNELTSFTADDFLKDAQIDNTFIAEIISD